MDYNEQQLKDLMSEGATNAQMAEFFGVHERTVRKWKARMAVKGFSPEHQLTRQVPDPFIVKGTSQLYRRGEVEPVLEWVKTSISEQRRLEMMREAVEAFKEDIPRAEAVEFHGTSNADLLNCYVISDYHFGQLSWGEETRGEDYDLKIAERQLVAWFGRAIELAPDAEVGLFAQVGDFLHYSGAGLQATTEASGHILDADGRFQKLVRTVIRVIRQVIQMLLEKHERLHILMCEGNHDTSASCWLREMLFAMYENEQRITVDRSADPYYAYEFGETSLFFHHGHKKRISDIATVFAGKFRELFGRTSKSYGHMGHLHHIDVKENNLMVIEQHRTLAAPDAHASRGGWMSGREAKVITYHKIFGEVSRLSISSDMLK